MWYHAHIKQSSLSQISRYFSRCPKMKVYEEKRVSPDSTFKVVDRVPKMFLKAELLQLLMATPKTVMLVSQQAENRQMLVLRPF